MSLYKAELTAPNLWRNMAERHDEDLAREIAALHEDLRSKELECDALAHDKSVLLSFVKRVSGLDAEIASDASDLLDDIQSADYYCQCENSDCGAWYQIGKDGDTCKECKTGKLTPQQVEEY